jgi:CRP-like cAMP-binding protein
MIFDRLTQMELTAVEKTGQTRSYKVGDTIIKEGIAGTSFGVILKGRVEVRKTLRLGQCKALVELGPLDLIGELGFFGAPSRSASVVAITDCEMLEFDKETFEKMTDERPVLGCKVYRAMAEILAKRLTSSDENLMDTIIWALGQAINKDAPTQISIDQRPKLTIRPIA